MPCRIQFMANNTSTIKTAKWPTLILFFITSTVILSEKQIISMTNNSETIQIVALQAADEDNETDEELEIDIDENVLSIIDSVYLQFQSKQFSQIEIKDVLANKGLTNTQIKIAIAQLGKKFHHAKQYQQTEKVLLILNSKERLQLGMQFKLAYSQSKQSKNNEAINSYRLLTTSQPNNQSARINLSLLFNKTEQYNKAIESFSNAVEITSGKRKAKAYAGLGAAYFQLFQFEDAVGAFQKSIEYRPKYATTWKYLARTLNFTQDSTTKAKETYENALALTEKDYRLHNEYGLFLLSKLDFIGSTEQFKKAQKLSKNAVDVRFNLALSYLERGRYRDARKQLSWIMRKKKNTPQHNIAIALYNLSKKNFDLASEQLNILKLASPNDITIEYYLTRILSLTNNTSAAISKYQQIKTDNQWKHMSELRQSRDLIIQKKYPQSLLLVNKLLQETLNKETLLYQKSNLLMMTGDNINALAAIKQAYEISPTSNKMSIRYASLLHKTGKSESAINILIELLTRKPQTMRGRVLLAEIYLETSQMESSIEQYQIAIITESDNLNVKFKLASILVTQKLYNQANVLLTDLLTQKSNHLAARILLAQSKFFNSEIQQSLKEINLALKLEPENLVATNLKIKIMEHL